MKMSFQARGILITTMGVLVFSPDGLLIRLLGTDTLTTTFWRSLFYSAGMLFFLSLWFRSRIVDAFFGIGLPGLLLAVLYFIGNLGFVYSITHTAVANTLFIMSTTPFWAALFAWCIFKEKVAGRTWLAILISGAGVGIICAGESVMPDAWLGNLAGLAATAALAGSFTVIARNRERNLFPSFVLGGFGTALVLEGFVSPSQTSDVDLTILFVMGFIMLPIGALMMFFGPKLISAPETSLLMLLESILGPLWVWLVLNEYPGHLAMIGGVIILVTLTVHGLVGIREARFRRNTIAVPVVAE